MLLDLTIMIYVILMVLLIHQAEKLPQYSLKVIFIGLILTPIIGAISLAYFHRQIKLET